LIDGSTAPPSRNCARRATRVTRVCCGATSDLCSAKEYCPQSLPSTCRAHTSS
jgi:hypothetical protein